MPGQNLGYDPGTATRRHVHVDEHDVGDSFRDQFDRGVDIGSRADHIEVAAATELAANTSEEQFVVVDDEDLDRHDSTLRAMANSTSVPSPTVLVTVARPPWRCM